MAFLFYTDEDGIYTNPALRNCLSIDLSIGILSIAIHG